MISCGHSQTTLSPFHRCLYRALTEPFGKSVSREDYERRMPEWISSESDRAFVNSLMKRVVELGRYGGLDRATGTGH